MAGGFKWSFGAEQTLLNFYRDNPPLWNPNDIEYYNKQRRLMLLEQLSIKLERQHGLQKMSVNEIRKKFKNLRTTFVREASKIEKSRKSATSPQLIYVSRWPHMCDCAFLTVLREIQIDSSTDNSSVSNSGDTLVQLQRQENFIEAVFVEQFGTHTVPEDISSHQLNIASSPNSPEIQPSSTSLPAESPSASLPAESPSTSLPAESPSTYLLPESPSPSLHLVSSRPKRKKRQPEASETRLSILKDIAANICKEEDKDSAWHFCQSLYKNLIRLSPMQQEFAKMDLQKTMIQHLQKHYSETDK